MNRDNPILPSPSRRALRLGLFGLALSGAPLANAQAIYYASEQAGPGSTISVTGDGLDANATFTVYPYTSAGVRGTGVTVAPDTTNTAGTTGTSATLRLPTSLSASVYEVAATTTKGKTNSVFVNRARMQWTDVPDAMPGQTVHIVGRNFVPFSGRTPTVTLTNASTRAVLTPTILSASDTVIKIQVPASAAAGTYTISLNNGVAGSASADPATQSLTVRAAANDPFSLGVAWGADCNAFASNVWNVKTDPRLPVHAVGNGVTDDTNAFAIALYYASLNGGGIVYAPAGTYRIDSGTVTSVIYGNTTLQGAGRGQTILQVGYTYTPTSAAPTYVQALRFAGGNSGPEGLADLTVQNLNTNPTPNIILNGVGMKEAFIKDVDFQMGNGQTIWLQSANDLMIADCNFTSTSMVAGALRVVQTTGLQFLRNTEYHRVNRLAVLFSERSVLEGNTIQFDNNYRNASTPETGGTEMSGDQQLLVSSNTIGSIGAFPNRPAGDGELVLTQLAILQDFMYTGMAKPSTSRTLIPASAFPTTSWIDPNYATSFGRTAVAIISGKGMGQWRRVTSQTTGSVMIDQPWVITPDATSRFEIISMNNYQQTYTDNQLSVGFYGIEFENGSFDSTIEGNSLTDAGSIAIYGYTSDYRSSGTGSNYSFTASWNDAILKNTLTDASGVRPATISLAGLDDVNLNMGPLLLNTDVRGNTIVGHFMQPISAEAGRTDGLEVISYDENFASTGNNVLVQGTVLQDNVISNTNYPIMIYNMSTGNGFLSNGPSTASN